MYASKLLAALTAIAVSLPAIAGIVSNPSNTGAAAAPTFDKTKVIFWNGLEGFATGTSNNCTVANIHGGNDPMEMDCGGSVDNCGTANAEYSAGDSTGVFVATNSTNIKVTTGAALNGNCGLEFNGTATTHHLRYDITAGDIFNGTEGCVFMQVQRKVPNSDDGLCVLLRPDTGGSPPMLTLEYLASNNNARGTFNSGASAACTGATGTMVVDTTYRMMVRYSTTSPYVQVYIDGSLDCENVSTAPSISSINRLKFGGLSSTCTGTTNPSWYIDDIIISNDVTHCDGTGTDVTLDTMFNTEDICAGGCTSYDQLP